MYRYLLSASIYALLITAAIFGQSTINPDRQQAEQRRKEQRDLESNRGTFKSANKAYNDGIKIKRAPRNRNSSGEASLSAIRKEEKKLASLRTPDPEDTDKYKEFLKQPKTGLFRLFPDLDCESKNLVRVDGNCENAVLASSSYSFRQKDYVKSKFLDIRFKDGNIIADGFLSQEIIFALGDVSLEDISLESSGIKFLYGFEPKKKIQDAKRQFAEISRIINADGYKYGKIAKAYLNTTYAMRIIAYRNMDKRITPSSYASSEVEREFWNLEDDKRTDLIIAFRIIRQDENGSLTILWKELNRRSAPKLVFAKNEIISDIKP